MYLTDKKSVRDVLGAAWLIIALRVHAAKLEIAPNLTTATKDRGITRIASDSGPQKKKCPKKGAPYRSLGRDPLS